MRSQLFTSFYCGLTLPVCRSTMFLLAWSRPAKRFSEESGSSSMKARRYWNERTRLMLTLELAVVLPAAVLVIWSAWHVKHIQRDRAVEAAIQRDFSHVLTISEK